MGKIFCLSGEIAICHYYWNMAIIISTSGKGFLHCFVSDIRRITFALYAIFYTAFLGKNIDSLISTTLCNTNIVETIIFEQLSTIIFEVVSFHCIVDRNLWFW